ncbi:MAG: hypothetical protein LBQ55_00465 [Treponema sp.]|jgi:hypothetical protein|nr:hypothetical protein [Treponema sp.]
MTKHINFEDNIFILNVRIRMIRDLLALDADPGLFLDKTIDDIEFIDYAMGSLLALLVENNRLLERDEELDNLSNLEWQFSQILSDFFNSAGTISAVQLPVIREKIMILRNHSLERRKTIDKSRDSGGKSAEPLVSSDELSELLKDF